MTVLREKRNTNLLISGRTFIKVYTKRAIESSQVKTSRPRPGRPRLSMPLLESLHAVHSYERVYNKRIGMLDSLGVHVMVSAPTRTRAVPFPPHYSCSTFDPFFPLCSCCASSGLGPPLWHTLILPPAIFFINPSPYPLF